MSRPSPGGTVLVIGDLILDVIHQGHYIGRSNAHPDTPVIHEDSTSSMWGGAGFLVRNILELGGTVTFISVIGNSRYNNNVYEFTHPNLNKRFLEIPGRRTVVKERFWSKERRVLGWYHLDEHPLSLEDEEHLIDLIRSELPKVQKVAVADYRHGLFSATLAVWLVEECRSQKVPLYVDSQITDYTRGSHRWYRGADVFCLNEKEAEHTDSEFEIERLPESLQRLQEHLNSPYVVVKLGAQGSSARLQEAYVRNEPHLVTEVDSIGAGDAFLGCLLMGQFPPTKTDLVRANIWAALSVTKIGTELPDIAQYQRVISTINEEC